MKVVIALLALLAVAYAAPECRWGPSYWCQNKANAQQCGQLQYCQTQVWKVSTADVKSGILCTICEAAEESLKAFLDSNGSEAEVEDLLKEICSILPSTLGSECTQLVNSDFGLIFQVIKGLVDSGQLCNMIPDICTNSSAHKMLVKPKDSILCEACHYAQGEIKSIFDSQQIEGEAKAAVEALCSELGSEAAMCKQIVEGYFDMIWKLVDSYVDDGNLCMEIKLCTSNAAPVSRPKLEMFQPKVESGPFCGICEDIVEVAESYLSKNSTEADIEAALEKVCSAIPVVSTECKNFVDQYLPVILKLLESAVSPKEVCTLLKAC